MERLLFVLAAFEFTMACQPVPRPIYVGRGGSTAKIQLISDANYDPGKVGEYMGYFPQTKIEEYAAELGDFANLNWADIGGHFAYTFTIYNCDCHKVDYWMQQIVASSDHYQYYNLNCPYPRSAPTVVKEIVIEKPSTTKAPPTPKVVYLEQRQPEYIIVTPPPQQQQPIVVYGGARRPPSLQVPLASEPEEICDP